MGRDRWVGAGRRLVAGALVVALVGAVTLSSARANDIQPFKTVFATDVAYAGLGGLRGTGAGTLTLSGVTGTVKEAHLFWHGPTNSSDANSNAAVSFAGQTITGTNIGLSSDNCWGFQNSQAYRATVTSLVTGNGTFALANFTKTDADINGAQLIVFYDDGNAANNRDVVLFEGNDSNTVNSFDAPGWNITLAGIQYVSGTATMDLVVSDGQSFDDGTLELNSATLDPGPTLFQGTTVPSANSAAQNLWDTRAFDITSAMTPGANTLNLTHARVNDCLSLIVAAVNLPAGAAPGQPTTTTTTTSTTTTTAPPLADPPADPPAAPPAAAQPVVVAPRFTG